MRKAHLNIEEILTEARQTHGLARMDQTAYAVMEKSGGISVVPRKEVS